MEESATEYKATGILSNELLKTGVEWLAKGGIDLGLSYAAEKIFGAESQLPSFQGDIPSY
jgi:hypothetical protein